MPKAEIVPGAQARHHEPLLRIGGRRLFQDGVHLVEPAGVAHAAPADAAVKGQEALVRGLYRRHRALLLLRHLDEVLGAPRLGAGDVQVVAHQVQEGLALAKVAGAVHRVAITERLLLLDKGEPVRIRPRRRGVGRLVSRADHDTDLLDPRAKGLLGENGQERLVHAVAIGQGLQGQRALVAARRRDHGFDDSHPTTSPYSPLHVRLRGGQPL